MAEDFNNLVSARDKKSFISEYSEKEASLIAQSLGGNNTDVKTMLEERIKSCQAKEQYFYNMLGFNGTPSIGELNDTLQNQTFTSQELKGMDERMTGPALRTFIGQAMIDTTDYVQHLGEISGYLSKSADWGAVREAANKREGAFEGKKGEKNLVTFNLIEQAFQDSLEKTFFLAETQDSLGANISNLAMPGESELAYVILEMPKLIESVLADAFTSKDLYVEMKEGGESSKTKLTRNLLYSLSAAGKAHIERIYKILKDNGKVDNQKLEVKNSNSSGKIEYDISLMTDQKSSDFMKLTKEQRDQRNELILQEIVRYVFHKDYNEVSEENKSKLRASFREMIGTEEGAFIQGKNLSGIIGVLGELRVQILLNEIIKKSGRPDTQVLYLGDELNAKGQKVSVDTAISFGTGKEKRINFQVKNSYTDFIQQNFKTITFIDDIIFSTVLNDEKYLAQGGGPTELKYFLVNTFNLQKYSGGIQQLIQIADEIFNINANKFIHLGPETTNDENNFIFINNYIIPASYVYQSIENLVTYDKKQSIGTLSAQVQVPEKKMNNPTVENLANNMTFSASFKFDIGKIKNLVAASIGG